MSKFKSLGARATSATIFAIVMIAGIYLHKVGLVLLFGVILFIGLRELFTLSFTGDEEGLRKYRMPGTVLAFSPYLWVAVQKLILPKEISSTFVNIAMFLLPVFIAMLLELLGRARQQFLRVAFVALGIAYLTVPVSLVCDLAIQDKGFHPDIIMGLLVLIWISDTGAYFAGSAFGKHKLYPAISPGKTWEGSIGGAVITIITAWFFPELFGEFSAGQWVILGIIAVVFGTLGDLTESMLKRNNGVKDSGNIMPGHGGILDRFDAFIFLIPFAYLYIRLFIYGLY